MKSHSEIVFENDRFRATKWTIQPGGTIPMHRHEYDYVVVPLSNNLMHVTTADGELIEAALHYKYEPKYEGFLAQRYK